MSGKYRIIETKGEYKIIRNALQENIKGIRPGHSSDEYLISGGYCCEDCKRIYIPKFIVQKYYPKHGEPQYPYKNIKEFTSLEEAREFKRDLELEDGIVVE